MIDEVTVEEIPFHGRVENWTLVNNLVRPKGSSHWESAVLKKKLENMEGIHGVFVMSI